MQNQQLQQCHKSRNTAALAICMLLQWVQRQTMCVLAGGCCCCYLGVWRGGRKRGDANVVDPREFGILVVSFGCQRTAGSM